MLATRPDRPVNTPRRAVLFTAGMLIAMLGAAYLVSQGPGGQGLGDPVTPAGWQMSFSPPHGWAEEGNLINARGVKMRRYRGLGERELTFGRAVIEGETNPESFCLDMLGDADMYVIMEGARDIRMTETKVGEWPAVQLDWTPQIFGQAIGPHVYLIGVISPADDEGNREGYVVEMRSPAPITPSDKRTWDMIVGAVTVAAEGT
ncbi:MAG: hypothetical protein H6817_02415 [Phycisphaerales bacterium]|nr:hypothetical protein [Phycisphaerales bacterium]